MEKVDKNEQTSVNKTYIDRSAVATILGVTKFWLDKMVGKEGCPRCVRHGRKSWYRTDEVLAYKEQRDAEARRREAEGEPGGARYTPQPPDEELERAFAGPGWKDQNPTVTALETLAKRFKATRRDDLDGAESWPDGLYDTPFGLLVHRRGGR